MNSNIPAEFRDRHTGYEGVNGGAFSFFMSYTNLISRITISFRDHQPVTLIYLCWNISRECCLPVHGIHAKGGVYRSNIKRDIDVQRIKVEKSV